MQSLSQARLDRLPVRHFPVIILSYAYFQRPSKTVRLGTMRILLVEDDPEQLDPLHAARFAGRGTSYGGWRIRR